MTGRERWHLWQREIRNRTGYEYAPRLGHVKLRHFLRGLFQ